jgi:FtsZ-binding cell division protein ZapB
MGRHQGQEAMTDKPLTLEEIDGWEAHYLSADPRTVPLERYAFKSLCAAARANIVDEKIASGEWPSEQEWFAGSPRSELGSLPTPSPPNIGDAQEREDLGQFLDQMPKEPNEALKTLMTPAPLPKSEEELVERLRATWDEYDDCIPVCMEAAAKIETLSAARAKLEKERDELTAKNATLVSFMEGVSRERDKLVEEVERLTSQQEEDTERLEAAWANSVKLRAEVEQWRIDCNEALIDCATLRAENERLKEELEARNG